MRVAGSHMTTGNEGSNPSTFTIKSKPDHDEEADLKQESIRIATSPVIEKMSRASNLL